MPFNFFRYLLAIGLIILGSAGGGCKRMTENDKKDNTSASSTVSKQDVDSAKGKEETRPVKLMTMIKGKIWVIDVAGTKQSDGYKKSPEGNAIIDMTLVIMSEATMTVYESAVTMTTVVRGKKQDRTINIKILNDDGTLVTAEAVDGDYKGKRLTFNKTSDTQISYSIAGMPQLTWKAK